MQPSVPSVPRSPRCRASLVEGGAEGQAAEGVGKRDLVEGHELVPKSQTLQSLGQSDFSETSES